MADQSPAAGPATRLSEELNAELDQEIIKRSHAASRLALLRDLPDDALVRVPPGFEEEVPDGTYAATLEDLRRVIGESTGPYGFPDLDPANYEDQIVHEAEHAAAARAIGCDSRFLFKRGRHPARADVWYHVTVHMYAASFPLTKLAVAAIAAAPTWLSESDLADLHCMGYQDAADVAARIRETGQHLPVPLSAAAPARRQAARVPAPRPEPGPAWRPLIDAVRAFDPEDDAHLLAWMAGEAAGMARYAEGVAAARETAVTMAGVDPAAVGALDDYADAAAAAADQMAAARQRFAGHYAEVRQFAAGGGVLPYNGRWMTGENHRAPSAAGGEDARREPEAGTMTAADHLDVERWPIEKIGALRSGNNPELTVEEEHQMRMAGQGHPHRNDTMRAEAFGFPDARAYQQHVTDSMRDRGQVNPVEYRDEYDYSQPDPVKAPRLPTMTTGHHRYSGARILGWTHMNIKRQGPYGSQDKPVPGFEGKYL